MAMTNKRESYNTPGPLLGAINEALGTKMSTPPLKEPRTRPVPGMGIVSSRFPSCSGDTLLLVSAKLKALEEDISRQSDRLRACEQLEDSDLEALTTYQSLLTDARTSLASCLTRMALAQQ